MNTTTRSSPSFSCTRRPCCGLILLFLTLVSYLLVTVSSYSVTPSSRGPRLQKQGIVSSTRDVLLLLSSTKKALDGVDNSDHPRQQQQQQQPLNFREAEVLGLRLMQEGQHEEALKVFQKGLNLPGSRTDIIRTKTLSGPSPVGGSAGGTEGKVVQTLDEFELQAAHYNIACAYACLRKVDEACKSLEQAFRFGFDNYATVRADPDLGSIHGTPEFDSLMEKYDSKKGGGFFGFFK